MRRKGFTLVELLIVIAILGALAAVMIVALNPVQQLARARDAGRVSTIGQIGRSLEAYAASNSGKYVAEGATWIGSLVSAGEITAVPAAVTYSISGKSACSVNAQNGWCYDASDATGTAPIVAFASLESGSYNTKCSGTAVAWVVYSSADGKSGVVCSATAPVPGNQTFVQ